MRREAITALRAILALTLILGIGYPLLVTGLSQLAFSGAADGSLIERDGEVVGSSLIGQDFRGDDAYFHGRPSITGYAADATYFNNQGPNQKVLMRQAARYADAYLRRESPFSPGLDRASIPADAFTTSASGVDPGISPENAAIQAARIAEVRGAEPEQIETLVEASTTGRALGFIGAPSVNVVELNARLDDELGPPPAARTRTREGKGQ